MSISDERLAQLQFEVSAIEPSRRISMSSADRMDLLSIFCELQSLRAAAKVRAIREGDGEAEPVDPNSWEGAFARLTGADNLEAGAGDLVERYALFEATLTELQAICSDFGVKGGEKRTDGIRRVLTELTAENARLATEVTTLQQVIRDRAKYAKMNALLSQEAPK